MEGKILLLENPEGERPDGPLPMEQTRSLMGDLVNLGVFEQIVGLVIGRPTGYAGEELRQYEKMVLNMCSGVALEGVKQGEEGSFPVLAGVDVGHTDPLLTVPLGALMRLDAERNLWEILEPGVI
jgi:muramoyltetrapeptide carboxypeptidase LdcA involved in peptidoglycan recycling